MAEATLITDQRNGRHPSLKVVADGSFGGTRHYLVNTDDVQEAFVADGLPAIGSPWSGTLSAVRAWEIEHVESEGGYTILRVTYGVRPYSWPVGAAPGQARTVVTPIIASDNIIRSMSGRRLPWSGVPVEFMQYQVEVTRYYDTPGLPLFAEVDPAAEEAVHRTPVNSDELVLPPLPDGTDAVVIAVGRARYVGYRGPVFEGVGLYSITHILKMAIPDWKYRYKEEDEQGNVVGGLLAEDIYPSIPLMPILA